MSSSPEPDKQMFSGIQMIQQAFKTQSNILTEEISHLHQQLELKNEKIEELELLSQNLIKDNKHLNQLVEKLMDENNKMNQLNGNNQQSKAESTPSNSYCYNLKKQNSNAQGSNALRFNNQKMDNIIFSLDDSINKIVKTNSNYPIKKSVLSIAPLKRIDYSASNIRVNDHTDDVSSERKSENTIKSKNQTVNTDFFKSCRSRLKKVEYSQLIDIVKISNAKIISKKETYTRIEKLLGSKYNELFKEFKEIFQYNE